MRVKTGYTRRKRHKKILKTTKGYRMTNNRLYRRAHEAFLHAGSYSYKDRRRRPGQFRKLWITRISAALKKHGKKYSEFIHQLKKTEIELNRKVLAQLAVSQPQTFDQIVKTAFGA